MTKNKRIEKLSKKHFQILDILEKYYNGELRDYYEFYRLVDEQKNPVCNFKKFYIDDLIEHNNILKNKRNFTIIKN